MILLSCLSLLVKMNSKQTMFDVYVTRRCCVVISSSLNLQQNNCNTLWTKDETPFYVLINTLCLLLLYLCVI